MNSDDIVAIATGAGGALAVIRTSGATSIERVAKVFSRPKALITAPANTTIHGWILAPIDGASGANEAIKTSKANNANETYTATNTTNEANATNTPIPPPPATAKTPTTQRRATSQNRVDEVVLSIFRAPKSYTGENMVEISTHAGLAANLVFDALLAAGFTKAERGEFTLRAFLAGKLDLTAAESVTQVIAAKTSKALTEAQSHLNGELFSKIESIKRLLIDSVSAIEVDVEYPEDENTIAPNFSLDKARLAEKALRNLVKTFDTTRIFNEGVKVSLLGATNAGKSTLFNALLKTERSIVSPIAGTTRDYIEATVDLGGVPVVLFDTAGLRETSDEIEAVGVEKSLSMGALSALVLYLIDANARATKADEDFIRNCATPLIIALTKCDEVAESAMPSSPLPNPALLKKVFTPAFLDSLSQKNLPIVLISAKESFGLDALIAAIKKAIFKNAEPSEEESVALANTRQLKLVAESQKAVAHGLAVIDYSIDGAIEDFLSAIDSLAQVTGEVTTDDILGNIFSKFCVGK